MPVGSIEEHVMSLTATLCLHMVVTAMKLFTPCSGLKNMDYTQDVRSRMIIGRNFELRVDGKGASSGQFIAKILY